MDDVADADPAEFARRIRPTGFYRTKTRNILAMAKAVRDLHGGRLPRTMEGLVALPGIGRKTANVVLYNAWGKNEGIAVDTHVARITNLLGLTCHADPVKIESDLVRLVPKDDWGDVTHLLIAHGRAVCVANRPRCAVCLLKDVCPSANVDVPAQRTSP